ncbi:MAG TPA: hypothetical protein VN253_24670 [Kofleriaceae bacterium]|nr:hypothetical protein [Kofleriaceae bacterium]
MRNISDPALDPPNRKGVDKRMVAIVLAFAAAGCLIVAAFSKSWMGNPSFSGLVRDSNGRPSDAGGHYFALRGDIRFGPLGFERCARPYRGFEMHETHAEETCAEISTAELNTLIGELDHNNRDKYTSSAFAPTGWLAFGSCLLSALALMVTAGLALARKRKELPVSPASLALLGLLAAMAAGCVFIATKPGPAGMLGVDLGFWSFGAGTVIGMLGAQMLAKEIRPADPDLLAGALTPDDFSAFPTSFVRPARAPSAVPSEGDGGGPPGDDSPGAPADRGDVSA